MLLLTNKWYNFVYHFQSHVIKETNEEYYKSEYLGGGVGIQKIKLVVLAMLLYKVFRKLKHKRKTNKLNIFPNFVFF